MRTTSGGCGDASAIGILDRKLISAPDPENPGTLSLKSTHHRNSIILIKTALTLNFLNPPLSPPAEDIDSQPKVFE